MRILAIDSSGMTASAAVLEDDRVIAEYSVNFKQTHSQTLLPMIDEMLGITGISADSLEAVAIAKGPGSFTGLRIGSATAKGLGLALGIPVIPVPTVDALAYSLYGCTDIICPVMDARRGQVYTGIYTFSGASLAAEGGFYTPRFRVLRMQMAVSAEDLILRLNRYGRPVVLLGDGVPVYRKLFEEKLEVPFSFAPPHMNRQRAAAVGALGLIYAAQGNVESAAEHRPEYLRLSQAERERLAREKTEKPAVRRMVREDGAAVSEIEQKSFPDPWSEKAAAGTLANPAAVCLSAEKSSRIAGYLFAYTAADEAELVRIAVLPQFRRQHVADALIRELVRQCDTMFGVKRVFLEVRRSNLSARAFYEKEGFRETGIRKGFYANPPEDAVCMSLDIEEKAAEAKQADEAMPGSQNTEIHGV